MSDLADKFAAFARQCKGESVNPNYQDIFRDIFGDGYGGKPEPARSATYEELRAAIKMAIDELDCGNIQAYRITSLRESLIRIYHKGS